VHRGFIIVKRCNLISLTILLELKKYLNSKIRTITLVIINWFMVRLY